MIDTILDYWFGPLENGLTVEPRQKLWYGSTPEIDEHIRTHFEDLLQAAARGELNDWADTPRGRLALIILLDQFSRNIYRRSAQAFAHDNQAQQWVLDGIELGHDKTLASIERSFFYMPLEHAEDLQLQQLCVDKNQELLADMPEALRPRLTSSLEYAEIHRDIIQRFGRFPHRNEVLKRQSTTEELEYLEDGHRFGQ